MIKNILEKSFWAKLYKENKAFFLSFGALFAVYLVWWLSYFPGTLSPDSISHWYEASSFSFSNASPYLYSLIMALLIRVWNTPAMMGLLQLLLLSTTVSLFLNYAFKKGVNKKIIFLVAAFFVIHPMFGIYNITIWKDVIYSYVVLAALLLTVIIQIDKKFQKHAWYYLLAVLVALIPLFRFNGIVFFVFLPLFLFISKAINLKKFGIFLGVQLGVYFFFSVVLLNLLHVIPAPMMQEGIYVKLVGAIYHLEKPNLSAEQSAIFKQIMPEKTWEKYYQCITVDPLFYTGLAENRSIAYNKPIDPDPKFVDSWHHAVFAASLGNPEAIIYDKACMGAYLLGVKNIFYKYEEKIYQANEGGPLHYESKLPLGKRALNKYLKFVSAGTPDGYGFEGRLSKIINFVFWSAIIPALIYLAFGLIALKKRLMALGTFVLLMILNIGAVILLVPAASFRYMFVLFVAVPFLPLIYLLEEKR